MSNIIEVFEVSKKFGEKTVLDKVSINVPQGSVYGFLGNNGAGKSTLIRVLLNLINSNSGEFSLFGKKINPKDTSYRQKIGCLVESPCLYLQLTPLEFLSIAQRLKKLPQSSIDKALDVVAMTEFKNQPMSQFSLGMKQRIAIANALLGEPPLLILDEPTNGLDPRGIQEIRMLLKSLPEQINSTVFLSSHLLDEIQKTASHVAILNQGCVQVESTLKDLLATQTSYLQVESTHNDALFNGLKEKNLNVNYQDDRFIKIKDIAIEQCPDIHQVLYQLGLPIVQTRFINPSLEKVFFNQTATA